MQNSLQRIRSRRWAVAAVVVLLVIVAIVPVYQRYVEKSGEGFILNRGVGLRRCALTWADFVEPCNFAIANAISVRDPDLFIRLIADPDFTGQALTQPSKCQAERVEHVGNRQTAFALSNQENFYSPLAIDAPNTDPGRALTSLRIGAEVCLCRDANHRRFMSIAGTSMSVIRLW